VLWIPLGICVALYIAQLLCVVLYAVNIPYWDEWEAFNKGGILVNQTVSQLFAQHNEHRIVTTKLLTLALYHIDGWNLVTHQTINFLIYGTLVAIVIYIVKKGGPDLPLAILLCFAVFLLSDVSWENHAWGFQSQFHFTLLFLVLASWCLFDERQRWSRALAGAFFLLLTVYSFSAGVVESLVLFAGYLAFKIFRKFSDDALPDELKQLAVVGLIVAAGIGLYFVGYVKPDSPPYTLPYQKLFWTYLANLLSGGLGYARDNILPGSIILFFVLIPIVGLIKQKGRSLSSRQWMLIVTALSILAALVVITVGRAGYGKGQSKSSRYSEFTVMLVPISVSMWWLFLSQRRRLLHYLLIGFWLFCGFGLSRSWNFPKRYSRISAERLQARECVQSYYLNGGPAICPTAYPHSLADRLEFARDMPLSFIQEMQK
jgi:hypothetical protein